MERHLDPNALEVVHSAQDIAKTLGFDYIGTEHLLAGIARQIGTDAAAAKELLVRQGYDPRYGARPLRRTVNRLLTNELAGMILDGRYSSGGTVKVSAEGGALAFS